MYNGQTQVSVLPASGVGVMTSATTIGGVETLYLSIALVTLFMAAKTVWKMVPRKTVLD